MEQSPDSAQWFMSTRVAWLWHRSAELTRARETEAHYYGTVPATPPCMKCELTSYGTVPDTAPVLRPELAIMARSPIPLPVHGFRAY